MGRGGQGKALIREAYMLSDSRFKSNTVPSGQPIVGNPMAFKRMASFNSSLESPP